MYNKIYQMFKGLYLWPEKKILAISFLAGCMSVFSSPPFFYVFGILFSVSFFSDLLYRANSLKQRIGRLLCFSAGYHLVNFYWILLALTVDPVYYWIIPFAAIFICSVFALFFFVVFLPYLLFADRFRGVLLHAACVLFLWNLFEFVKVYFPFGGLPWQPIGMIFAGNDYTIQIAYYIGIWGCNGLALLLAIVPFLTFRLKSKFVPIIGITIYVAVVIFGHYRIKDYKQNERYHDLAILGIQGNVSPQITLKDTDEDEEVLTYMKESQIAQELPNKNVLLIWPEGTIGAYSDFDIFKGEMLAQVMGVIPNNVEYLAFGSLYFQTQTDQWFNRITVIDRKGKIVDYYDKMNLVPFGEYIPTRNFFPFLTHKITRGLVDQSIGKEYKNIKVNGITFAPLICFESIFAAHKFNKKAQEADVILQITNDVWFGNSVGPYQHLAFSKMLSVIYKMPLIRISNNGISAIYNQYGILLQSTKLNTSGIIYESKLPQKS